MIQLCLAYSVNNRWYFFELFGEKLTPIGFDSESYDSRVMSDGNQEMCESIRWDWK